MRRRLMTRVLVRANPNWDLGSLPLLGRKFEHPGAWSPISAHEESCLAFANLVVPPGRGMWQPVGLFVGPYPVFWHCVTRDLGGLQMDFVSATKGLRNCTPLLAGLWPLFRGVCRRTLDLFGCGNCQLVGMCAPAADRWLGGAVVRGAS